MNRNFGIVILIICFSSSTINFGFADVMPGSPAVPQPEVQQLTQEVLNRDRQNRDEEIAIQGLIEENNKLTQETLARQEDEGLQKINETMLSYRNALLSRDQSRIMANSERWSSRYGDLVALTEDADAMTVNRGDLESKNELLLQKLQMLTALKDEMVALNEKLKNQSPDALNQKDKIIEDYKEAAQLQSEKIQDLVTKLAEMDQKISHFDEIIADKDRQIAELKVNLAAAQNAASQNKGQGGSATNDDLQAQVLSLKTQIQEQADDLKAKDETLKEEEDQIAILQKQPKDTSSSSSPTNSVQLPPMIVNTSSGTYQVDLSPIYVNLSTIHQTVQQVVAAGPDKDKIIKQQNKLIKLQSDQISKQADQLTMASEQYKKRGAIYADLQAQLVGLRNRIHKQDLDLKAKSDALKWLNQVLVATKNKAEYFKLTAQQQQIAMHKVQREVMDIKDDFTRNLKEYAQFGNIVVDLKGQVSRLNLQLSQKQTQVDLLKSELENKISQEDQQSQQAAQAQQDLKDQLQDKETQLIKMRADILAIQQRQDNDDRLKLAQQLVNLQQEEASLLQEKSRLALEEFTLIDRHVLAFENRIKELLAAHRIQAAALRGQMEELKTELYQKQQQVELLNTELKNEIAQQKNQGVLEYLIRDLKTRLQDREDQISALRAEIQSGQDAQGQVDILKQELAEQQNKADLLKQELNNKTAESNKMILMMEDYQQKLEAQSNAYNEELRQVDLLNSELRSKISQEKDQGVLEDQVQDLKSQLQDKEERIISLNAQIKSGQVTYEEAESLKQELAEQQNKVDLLKQELESKATQSDQTSLMVSEYQQKLESKNDAYNQELKQVLLSKNEQAQMEEQIADLSARLQKKEAQVIKVKKDMYDLQELTAAKDRDAQAKDLTLSMTQQKILDEKISEYQEKIDGLQTTNDKQAQEVKSLRDQLALARQQLSGMPSSDEIDFLRTGLKKATLQLKQKDAMIAQIKANADEYEKEFKAQSDEFQSLKSQLQDAMDEINHKNEDLKYKNMEVVRLKERSTAKEDDLQGQVKVLTRKLDAAQKGRHDKTYDNDVKALQAQLKQALVKINEQNRTINALNRKLHEAGKNVKIYQGPQGKPHVNKEALEDQLDAANARIKDLQSQLDQFILPTKKDILREKLKQALDKIDAQGRVINLLVDKLHEVGESVDLSKEFAKP